jgi:hypothetical protein
VNDKERETEKEGREEERKNTRLNGEKAVSRGR